MQPGRSLRSRLYASACGLSVLVVPVLAGAAHAGGALPSGGQYVAGKGAIGGSSGSLTVNQSTTTGIIDWNSFSIGKGNAVTFNNGSGATLNEVTGGNLSTIAGSLHASGSVYLINPEGIIVSGTGKIVTGGTFSASTQGPDGKQHGNIVDAGSITSTHGSVSLNANNVSVPG
jgi:filamentous hemagglutinin family protein